MDRVEFRKRVLLHAVVSPWSVVPALVAVWAGATAGLIGAPLGLFALTAFLAAGVAGGAAVGRLMFRTQAIGARVVDENRQKQREQQEARLHALETRLEKTREVRTFEDIRLLRRQRKRVHEAMDDGASDLPPDLAGTSDRLYRSCVDSLERSAVLWEAARKMTTAVEREKLMQRRQRLLTDVDTAVRQWARALDRVQASSLTEGRVASADRRQRLADLGRELEVHLEVAHRVEQRMRGLERELSGVREAPQPV